MSIPLVSIIVPCYNQGSYLSECLHSIHVQSFIDWECIIINDGSNDNTEDISLEWIKKDKRFKYIYQDNQGVSAARNAAIEKACGKLILPLDGDDKIGNKYIQLGVNVFSEDKETDLVYCNAEYFGIEQGPCDLPPFDRKNILLSNMILSCALFKKDAWKSVGGYDIKMKSGYEDWEFWINLIYSKKDFKVIKLDYIGFYYRRKEFSRDVNVALNIRMAKKLVRYIERKHLKHYLPVLPLKLRNRILRLI